MSSSKRALLILLLLIVVPSAALANPVLDTIRIMTPALTAAFQDLYSASPSARRTIHEIAAGDLLIHVVALPVNRRRALTGTTHFVVRAGGRRILRIAVDETLGDDRRAAALAHELHHALEVARAAWVIDRASFAALYRDIGHQSECGAQADCYETPAAVSAGRRAFSQFRSRRAAAAPTADAANPR